MINYFARPLSLASKSTGDRPAVTAGISEVDLFRDAEADAADEIGCLRSKLGAWEVYS